MGILAKVKAAWAVLRKGEELTNAERWKRGQITVNAVAVFLAAVVGAAKTFGFDIPLSDEVINQIATGVIGLAAAFNTYVTAATSKRVGLRAADPVEPPRV